MIEMQCMCVEKILYSGTKMEIKMKKAESGSWTRLDIPRKQFMNIFAVFVDLPNYHRRQGGGPGSGRIC